jgi:hypothetical protein
MLATLRLAATETCYVAAGGWLIHPKDIGDGQIAVGAQVSLAERIISWLDKERSEGYNP